MKFDSKKWLDLLRKRFWGPLASILFHLVMFIILANFAVGGGEVPESTAEVMMMETEAEPLEEVDKVIEKEIIQEKPPEEIVPPEHEIRNDAEYSETEEISDIPDPGRGRGLGVGTGTGVGDGDQAGLQISGAKSPLVMKGLFGNRGSGGRGRALSRFGGGDGTEGAVLRALRWLKKEQKPDGSWDGPAVPMTSWALLCYLAHGETPASEEFGTTVENAIKYLAGSVNSWPASYSYPIATYAICEAYGMTRVPMLKEVAYKGVDGVIRGQGLNGGWGYGVPTKDESKDTSVMGWCAQALKAAKLANIEHPDLDKAIKMAIMGFKLNSSPTGGFGYREPGNGGLTATGTLCMQLLGATKEQECRLGLTAMDPWVFKWDNAMAGDPIYYWYYATQAKFHAGGDTWNGWNKQFSGELVRNQVVLKGAGIDGKDIGYWECAQSGGKEVKGHSTGLVYNTTLCCLMLEVYYRYLPTYSKPDELKLDDAAAGAATEGVSIEISK